MFHFLYLPVHSNTKLKFLQGLKNYNLLTNWSINMSITKSRPNERFQRSVVRGWNQTPSVNKTTQTSRTHERPARDCGVTAETELTIVTHEVQGPGGRSLGEGPDGRPRRGPTQ
ncbi:unnamed protein product, partial [Nesidiocoris tenuis]